MGEAAERLNSIQVSHAVYARRFGSGLGARIVSLLDKTDADLVEKIAARLALIEERGFDTGPATTKRLEKILEEIRVINQNVYKQVAAQMGDELLGLAAWEAEFQAKALAEVLPFKYRPNTPTAGTLRAIVNKRPFQGGLLKEWIAGMEEGRARRLREALRIGLVEGESIEQMVRRIRGTKALGYSDGILDISRRSAVAVARTATNHVMTRARDDTYLENDDIVKGWRFLATLDGRTSLICVALSEQDKVYPVGKGPMPPRHMNCRSTTVPELKSWRELGFDVDDPEPDWRASMDGQVPADTTYDTFLKGKPEAFQDEVLGVQRAKLWRDGGVELGKFTDASGRVYTLDQLKKKDAEAFEMAGL
ncbi:phage minor head protein [Pacificimonas sp. ICDLI1SI03]